MPKPTALPLLAFLSAPVLIAAAVPPKAPPAAPDQSILVTGQRTKPGAAPIPMSAWRMAETDHVIVYSKGSDKEVADTARKLERLHFLLSMLLNRVDRPDDAIKLRVFLIGDGADFDQLHLGHARAQESPYPRAFPSPLYYDPRDDGPVVATAAVAQKIMLKHGVPLDQLNEVKADPATGVPGNTMGGPGGAVNPDTKVDELAYELKPEGRLYAGFARHFLLTYFPAAYPRWYLEGFGEIFATMDASQEGRIEYGRSPDGYWDVIQWYGSYKLNDVLDGRYLTGKKSQTGWTPYHAWALAHLLFFSDEWKAPLHNYLAAVARGASPDQAAAALGDAAKLQRLWSYYHGAKVPYEVMTYPKERFTDPYVRRLRMDEADYVTGKLVLGARVEIPDAAAPGASPEEAAKKAQEHRDALDRRAHWLIDLREAAARNPDQLTSQLLLAEGACRSGERGLCASASDAALRLVPDNRLGLAWNGVGALENALAVPAGQREAALADARREIVKANRADTEATIPLLAYYSSYADAGQAAPDPALAGLLKAADSVPAAPDVALKVGEALAARGDAPGARKALLPVAEGAYDSPERQKARVLLSRLKR